jgi:anthranilate phosphoribosyltransferase
MHFDEAKSVFESLFQNNMNEKDSLALLSELHQRGENYEEIAAAAEVMRSHAVTLTIPDALKENIIDVVGTGGDKSGSFNVSTAASLLLASCGSYVAKHGNRNITSQSGSADVLEVLGVNLNLSPDQQITLLQECGFTFLFAQNHHPVMKYIMPLRKKLNHRTIFNLLGPLTNPAYAKKQLLGVFGRSFIEPMVQALKELNSTQAMVVSSDDGMDEISVSDRTAYAQLKEGGIKQGEIHPNDYGISLAPLDAIQGGDAHRNANIIHDILNNREKGAKRDIVLLNSGVALWVDGQARDIQEGIQMAHDSIDSGKAFKKLTHILTTSQKL